MLRRYILVFRGLAVTAAKNEATQSMQVGRCVGKVCAGLFGEGTHSSGTEAHIVGKGGSNGVNAVIWLVPTGGLVLMLGVEEADGTCQLLCSQGGLPVIPVSPGST